MEQQKADQDEGLLLAWLEAYEPKVKTLRPSLKRFLDRKEVVIWDCLKASHVFFLGFEAVDKAVIEASPDTVAWVKSVSRDRSAGLQSNQLAINLSTVLDSLVDELIEELCQESDVFRAKHHRLKRSHAFRTSASRRAGKQDWIDGLQALFGIVVDGTVAEYLREMVSVRNIAAHELLDGSTATNGETIANWVLSVKAMTWQLAETAERLQPTP